MGGKHEKEELDLRDFSEEMMLFGSRGSFGYFAVEGQQRISNNSKKAVSLLGFNCL